MVQQRQQETPPAPPLTAQLEAYVEAYAPRGIDADTWDEIRPFVLETLRHYRPETLESGRQRLTALTAYTAWAHERRYPLQQARLLDVDLIEAFAESADLGKTTAGNYRSRLRGITKKLNPAGTGAQIPSQHAHQAVKGPYTPREIAAIVRIARTQPSAAVGRQLRACVGLGLGAGLSSADLKPLRGRHIDDLGDAGIRVSVQPTRQRTVWVRREFEELVRAGINGLGRGELLLGKNAQRRNVAARVFSFAQILGDAPAFEQSRMRTTWLACLLTDGVPLPVIMDAAGLASARTLTDLLPMLDVAADPAELLRGGAR